MTAVIVVLLSGVLAAVLACIAQRPRHGQWICDEDGALVNLAHCEAVTAVERDGRFRIIVRFGADRHTQIATYATSVEADHARDRLAARLGASVI